MPLYLWIAIILCVVYGIIDSYIYKQCYYICDKCGTSFKPTYLHFITAKRYFIGYKKMKCPHCNYYDYMKAIRNKNERPK
jgi:hypothetical protein